MNLDSIAVSLFVNIFVDFDYIESEANPNNNLMIQGDFFFSLGLPKKVKVWKT